MLDSWIRSAGGRKSFSHALNYIIHLGSSVDISIAILSSCEKQMNNEFGQTVYMIILNMHKCCTK